MTAITFDTHKFVRKLQEAGFDQTQAEGLTDAMRAAKGETEFVTRRGLQIELAPLRADLNLQVDAGRAARHCHRQFRQTVFLIAALADRFCHSGLDPQSSAYI